MPRDLRSDAAQRFGDAFTLAAIGMAAVAFDGAYLLVNGSLCRLVGRRAEELLGLRWTDITHPEDIDATRAYREVILAGGDPGAPIERRYLRPDGSVVWALVVFDLVRDESGEPLYFFTQVLDITDRRRRDEDRFRITRERLEEAQRIARLGMYEFDAETGEVTWSDELIRVFGLDPSVTSITLEELIELVHPDDRGFLLVPAKERPTDGSVDRELRIIRSDGSIRWLLVRGRRYEEDGRLVRVVGTALDITERKDAEEAVLRALEAERAAADRLRTLDQARDAFLTSISHELRTPLTAITGYIRLLKSHGARMDEDRRREILDRTTLNAVRLEKLLTDILDVDRLDRGILQPRREPTDLTALVLDVIERSSLDEHGRVSLELGESVLADVDASWTERIVENLVSNVLKHTPAGTGVRVRVGWGDGAALIEVEDEGPGMSEAVRDEAFERFTLGPTAPSHSPGLGLGLPLVKQLVTLQGGTVSIGNGEGGGAVVRVTLPLAEDPG